LRDLGLAIAANAANYIAKTLTFVDCGDIAKKSGGIGSSAKAVLNQPAIQNSCPFGAGKLWQLVLAATVVHNVAHLPAAHQKRIGQ
jgi:hypothetical protein